MRSRLAYFTSQPKKYDRRSTRLMRVQAWSREPATSATPRRVPAGRSQEGETATKARAWIPPDETPKLSTHRGSVYARLSAVRRGTRAIRRDAHASAGERVRRLFRRGKREKATGSSRNETRARPFRRTVAVTTRRQATRRGSTTRSGDDVSSTLPITATSWCREFQPRGCPGVVRCIRCLSGNSDTLATVGTSSQTLDRERFSRRVSEPE